MLSEMLIYLRERFPLWIYLPLSGFLALGLMSSLPEHGGGWFFAQTVLLLLVLLLPLRLLDDLSSIEEDRTRAPERWLCRTEELRFFWILLYGLFLLALCLLLLWFGPWNAAGYGALFGALHLWYQVASRIRSRSAHGLPPLIKYPVLILLVSSGPGPTGRMWASMVLVFAAFVIYEILHDPRYGHSWGRGKAIRFLPFVAVAVWFGVELVRSPMP